MNRADTHNAHRKPNKHGSCFARSKTRAQDKARDVLCTSIEHRAIQAFIGTVRALWLQVIRRLRVFPSRSNSLAQVQHWCPQCALLHHMLHVAVACSRHERVLSCLSSFSSFAHLSFSAVPSLFPFRLVFLSLTVFLPSAALFFLCFFPPCSFSSCALRSRFPNMPLILFLNYPTRNLS